MATPGLRPYLQTYVRGSIRRTGILSSNWIVNGVYPHVHPHRETLIRSTLFPAVRGLIGVLGAIAIPISKHRESAESPVKTHPHMSSPRVRVCL